MANVKINTITYENVNEVQIPLENGNGNASFIDTGDATATDEQILKGYTAYSGNRKLIGTLNPAENIFNKIGTFEVKTNKDGYSYIEGVIGSSTKTYEYKEGSYDGIGLFYIVPKYIDTTYTGVQLMSWHVSPAYLGVNEGNTNKGFGFNCIGVTLTDGIITSIQKGTTMAVGTYSIGNDEIYLSSGISVPCGEVIAYEVNINFQ